MIRGLSSFSVSGGVGNGEIVAWGPVPRGSIVRSLKCHGSTPGVAADVVFSLALGFMANRPANAAEAGGASSLLVPSAGGGTLTVNGLLAIQVPRSAHQTFDLNAVVEDNGWVVAIIEGPTNDVVGAISLDIIEPPPPAPPSRPRKLRRRRASV